MNYNQIILFTFLIFFKSILIGQNLVPNGDFELFSECPDDLGEFYKVEYWMNSSDTGTPDFFNVCNQDSCSASIPNNYFGNSIPSYSGNAYAGVVVGVYLNYYDPIVMPAKEYIMVELNETLTSEETYIFTFHVKRPELAIAGNSIQAHLSEVPLENTSWENINIEPNLITTSPITEQDWIKHSVEFISNGTEKYLTIGNFQDSVTLSQTIEINLLGNNLHCGGVASLFEDESILYSLIDKVSIIKKGTSLTNDLKKSGYMVLPNPTLNKTFTIASNNEQPKELSYQLFKQDGKVLLNNKNYQSGEEIDASMINTNGLHYLRVSDQNITQVYKVFFDQ